MKFDFTVDLRTGEDGCTGYIYCNESEPIEVLTITRKDDWYGLNPAVIYKLVEKIARSLCWKGKDGCAVKVCGTRETPFYFKKQNGRSVEFPLPTDGIPS
jgi:hypothetical protein